MGVLPWRNQISQTPLPFFYKIPWSTKKRAGKYPGRIRAAPPLDKQQKRLNLVDHGVRNPSRPEPENSSSPEPDSSLEEMTLMWKHLTNVCKYYLLQFPSDDFPRTVCRNVIRRWVEELQPNIRLFI